MPKYRVTSKSTELRLMEFMQSIALSMDACHLHKEDVEMTQDQNYNATYLITRLEVQRLVKEFDLINHRNLRKKQASFYRYFQHVNKWLEEFADSLEDDRFEMQRFFVGLIKLIQDAHAILHEDTNQKKRESIIQEAMGYFTPREGTT